MSDPGADAVIRFLERHPTEAELDEFLENLPPDEREHLRALQARIDAGQPNEDPERVEGMVRTVLGRIEKQDRPDK